MYIMCDSHICKFRASLVSKNSSTLLRLSLYSLWEDTDTLMQISMCNVIPYKPYYNSTGFHGGKAKNVSCSKTAAVNYSYCGCYINFFF